MSTVESGNPQMLVYYTTRLYFFKYLGIYIYIVNKLIVQNLIFENQNNPNNI